MAACRRSLLAIFIVMFAATGQAHSQQHPRSSDPTDPLETGFITIASPSVGVDLSDTLGLVAVITLAVAAATVTTTNLIWIGFDERPPLVVPVVGAILGTGSSIAGAFLVEDEAAMGGTLLGLGLAALATSIWTLFLPEPEPLDPVLDVHLTPGHGGDLVGTATVRWLW